MRLDYYQGFSLRSLLIFGWPKSLHCCAFYASGRFIFTTVISSKFMRFHIVCLSSWEPRFYISVPRLVLPTIICQRYLSIIVELWSIDIIIFSYGFIMTEHVVVFTISWLWWIMLVLKVRLGCCMYRLYYYRGMGVMQSFNHTKTWYTYMYIWYIYVYINICIYYIYATGVVAVFSMSN